MPGGFVRFRCCSGGILNYWPTTGTINFQGPAAAAAELEQALAAVVSGQKTLDPTRLLQGGI
jgi:hypothetical protein